MRYIIYPYRMSSKSAKALQQELKRVGHTAIRVYADRHYQPRQDDVIINWGSSRVPNWNAPMLNKPSAVGKAANKLLTFQALSVAGVQLPQWTTDKGFAEHAVEDGYIVFCRTSLTGHSGSGIVVATPENPSIVDAPLYTRAFNKTNEYRIHVFKGDVLDVQEKKKRADTGSKYDHYVWNHGNDFIFARQNIVAPPCVLENAIKAVQALGLDFGTVDVGYNSNSETCAIFEVNTACGLQGTTLTNYVEAITNV